MRNVRSRIITATVVTLFVGIIQPTSGELLHPLFPADPNGGRNFGFSVDINDSIAVIGVERDNDNGFNTGSAYLYDILTGQVLFKLLPDDPAMYDQFGYSVGISGTTVVVGANHDHLQVISPGAAYLFDTTTGQQTFKLTPNDAENSEEFGIAVAISGNIAIVGAFGDGDNGEYSGSAYLFDTTTGQQLHKLLPDDGQEFDHFGGSVAIEGSYALVGAQFVNDPIDDAGAVYVFDTTTGLQLFKLQAEDAYQNQFFGGSVDISGTTVIVGSKRDNNNTGAAYLFDLATGQQLYKLTPSDGFEHSWFGSAVAIHNQIAFIGSPIDNAVFESAGSAYYFNVETGQQMLKILPPINAITEFDQFGTEVAMSEFYVICAAPLSNVGEGGNQGVAFLYDKQETCPIDLNGDRAIDTADLGGLLGSFGNSTPFADINGDGIVDTADLGILLSAFGGGCP